MWTAIVMRRAAILVALSLGAGTTAEERPDHWSFSSPIRPTVPTLPSHPEWSSNPIDAFINASLARGGLKANGRANPSIQIRRLYLDLVGLPPTPSQLHDYLNDTSPDAYERVVKRLLSSPEHGERWARHWMDIWRYSDWYGRRAVPDVWNSAPQIWRWRDWIVRSLNHDRGYDQMLQDMIAADEIRPGDSDATLATAYLIRNWYALNPNDWMRNIVEHTGKAFLGLTFNCAHCHDHKYDPITQLEYFQFRAFFEPIGIRQDRVQGEADPRPFQEYEYSTLRKIQRLGAVRVYDKNMDAKTWFYSGGDERNREKERGPIQPAPPSFLSRSSFSLDPVALPPSGWYPGMEATILDGLIREAESAIIDATTGLEKARVAVNKTLPKATAELEKAKAKFTMAASAVENGTKPGALVGDQSLVLSARHGRRIAENSIQQLTAFDSSTTIEFQLALLADTHFNFQLVRDVKKGLTAAYVGFVDGQIRVYAPGGFTEQQVGSYDFTGGQNRFSVRLAMQVESDTALLTIQSLSDAKDLVKDVPIAINGWNPVGDVTKPISFDARTGSVAVLDQIVIRTGPNPEASESVTAPENSIVFDFEAPAYAAGSDIVGIDGWLSSSYNQGMASSLVSRVALNRDLKKFEDQRILAQRAVEAERLELAVAKERLSTTSLARKELAARIKAERARIDVTQSENKDTTTVMPLCETATKLHNELRDARALMTLHENELLLVRAELLTEKNKDRDAKLKAARSGLNAAQAEFTKVRASPASEFPRFSPTYPSTSTGRRRALALWMTDSSHPLTARVAVNHIWARHFHEPLVSTVFDFGTSGASPSHPELLDWLSVEFMESGWSMKHIHQLIVTSEAYRRSSRSGGVTANLQTDPENRKLWRMNVGRMEAEVVRDSLLHCADQLDQRFEGQELENSAAMTNHRRTLYFSCQPELDGKSVFGALFDAPDALDCYRRTESIIPQQALALTNNEFIHRLSHRIVGLEDDGTPNGGVAGTKDDASFVVAVFERILSRLPTHQEMVHCRVFLEKQTAARATDKRAVGFARASLVRVVMNHNDFVSIR